MNTKQVGQIVESKFVFECSKRGLTVSQPLCDNAPYDFILEFGGKLYKVQCKSLRKDADSYTAETHRKSGHRRRDKVSYDGLVDLFFLYNLEDDVSVYLPISEASKTTTFKTSSRLSTSRLIKDCADLEGVLKA